MDNASTDGSADFIAETFPHVHLIRLDRNIGFGAAINRATTEALRGWDKPFLTAFSDRDPITRGAERALQQRIPGAAGRVHPTVENAGHFLQEDRGDELARIVIDFACGR